MADQSLQPPRVALVSRGEASTVRTAFGLLEAVASALQDAGLAPEACVYDEASGGAVRDQLLGCAAALVWVNPVQDGLRRDALNALLAEVADAGVLVSAHPRVIAKMGVKAVLWRTREIGWSGDAQLYGRETLVREFPSRVAAGPRVLKQNRGNGGIGVWKVEAAGDAIDVLEAAGGPVHRMAMAEFLAERLDQFAAADGYVDQAFQPRLSEGMIRCYLCGDRVAGFGWQKVRALLGPQAGPASPRTYSGPDDPRFRVLRRAMEGGWASALTRILDIAPQDLPLLWDADFLFGPRDADGEDTFVLCEINASSVHPMPAEAPAAIARVLAHRLRAP